VPSATETRDIEALTSLPRGQSPAPGNIAKGGAAANQG
jgi:hypothetical protein